jgi:hypothetical protein
MKKINKKSKVKFHPFRGWRKNLDCHFDQREKSQVEYLEDFSVEDSFEMTVYSFSVFLVNVK